MNKIKMIPTMLLVVIIPILIVISVISLRNDHKNDVSTSEGESYLAALEKQDVRLVENGLREPDDNKETSSNSEPGSTGEEQTKDDGQEAFKLLEVEGFVGSNQKSYNPYGCDKESAQKLADRIESGELSTTELFKNTLFVGDSIMVGFSDYKIANSGNVIARVGSMLKPDLDKNIQTIIDYNPEVLFLHYGLNEMGEEEYHLEKYIEELKKDLGVLKEKLPDTKIVVVSLWPVKDTAIEAQARLARVPAYNKEIRKACVELGVAYEERAELFASNPELYHNDGIHCNRQMYMLWITDMIREMGLY